MKLHEISTFSDEIDFIIERSLNQLHQDTTGAFPSRNTSANQVRVKRKSFVKVGQNSLLVRGLVQGEEQDYHTHITFENVTFTNRSDPEAIAVSRWFIKPLSTNNNDVKVNCQCQDFRWTFAWYNSASGALDGNPPAPYMATTDRGPRNPTKSPGLCKHLICLSENLQAEKTFTD